MSLFSASSIAALPALYISRHMYLYATTQTSRTGSFLLVYRSLIVKDHHPIFKPVQNALDLCNWVKLAEGEYADKNMYFGIAVVTSYLLTPRGIP